MGRTGVRADCRGCLQCLDWRWQRVEGPQHLLRRRHRRRFDVDAFSRCVTASSPKPARNSPTPRPPLVPPRYAKLLRRSTLRLVSGSKTHARATCPTWRSFLDEFVSRSIPVDLRSPMGPRRRLELPGHLVLAQRCAFADAPRLSTGNASGGISCIIPPNRSYNRPPPPDCSGGRCRATPPCGSRPAGSTATARFVAPAALLADLVPLNGSATGTSQAATLEMGSPAKPGQSLRSSPRPRS